MSTVQMVKQPYVMAAFGRQNPLPDLHNVSYVHSQVVWDDSLTEDEVRYYRYGRVNSILPYAEQNGYQRDKKQAMMDTVVLQNQHVKAEFLPWMGGRLSSLEVDGKEMLSRNPVIQPCNLAIRNAWCSGGVEWNVSIRGHNMLTCEDLFTELITLQDGTAGVRFYEYERIRGIVYRIEAYLPKDSRFLFVQVHIENPRGNGEVPMYWWSNIAVPEEEGTRVITPADTGVISLYEAGKYRMFRHQMPEYEKMDLSRPCEIAYSVDVFFDLLKDHRPYITALGKDHTGLVQCSTARQLGRKLFVWGMGQGGRHWQEFLSDGKTSYIEIQAGITKTQQEHIPMPDGAVWEWLEAYGRMDCDVDALSFDEAKAACESVLDQMLPQEDLDKEFTNRGRMMAAAQGQLVRMGSGWGALANEMRLSKNQSMISDVCRFPADTLGKLQEQWKHLLFENVLPEPEQMDFPESYMIGAEWKTLLENAPQNALTAYYLGVMFHRDGAYRDSEACFEKSIALRENAPSYRALARLDAMNQREESCIRHYRAALRLIGNCVPLQLEYAQTLLQFDRCTELSDYLSKLPAEVLSLPRFQYLKACACAQLGQYDDALEIMQKPLIIADMREGELSLSDLWFRVWEKKENITREECEKCHPLPRVLDFRMH